MMWKYTTLNIGEWYLIQRKKGSRKQFYNEGSWGTCGAVYHSELAALEELRRLVKLELEVVRGLINGNHDQETMPTV